MLSYITCQKVCWCLNLVGLVSKGFTCIGHSPIDGSEIQVHIFRKPTCDLDVDVRLMDALHGAVEGDGATNGEQVHPVLGGVVRREQGLAVLLETLEALSLVPFTSRRRHRFLNEHL